MRHALAIFATLALPLCDTAAEVVCAGDAELRGEAPPRGRRQWCEDAGPPPQGPSGAWREQSRRRVEAHFEHGVMQGDYRSWHENGQLAMSGTYARDKREGRWESWYPSGSRARSQ